MKTIIEGRKYIILSPAPGHWDLYAGEKSDKEYKYTKDAELIQAVTDPGHPGHDPAEKKLVNLFRQDQ